MIIIIIMLIILIVLIALIILIVLIILTLVSRGGKLMFSHWQKEHGAEQDEVSRVIMEMTTSFLCPSRCTPQYRAPSSSQATS